MEEKIKSELPDFSHGKVNQQKYVLNKAYTENDINFVDFF